ncbi:MULTISPECIES: hypothetical protein [unclassified Muribaculum]|uniref:hypothetical protein n=1 Tax=unclassified Muribaculum TaxID=2622126 RepID=UPI00117F5B89|nr:MULTISPECIES: hypothetical protein [unclassified Muribaculum]
MKRSVIFTALSVLSSILCGISLFAQTGFDSVGQFDGYDFSTFTINGLEVGGPEYTEQDIIRAFGQPDTVEFDEFGYTYLYEEKIKILNKEMGTGSYSVQITLFNNPGPITCVYIADETCLINGYIRVGDRISKAYEMGGRFQDYKFDFNDGSGYVMWCPSGWGNADWIVCPKITYDKDGIIASFSIWLY